MVFAIPDYCISVRTVRVLCFGLLYLPLISTCLVSDDDDDPCLRAGLNVWFTSLCARARGFFAAGTWRIPESNANRCRCEQEKPTLD